MIAGASADAIANDDIFVSGDVVRVDPFKAHDVQWPGLTLQPKVGDGNGHIADGKGMGMLTHHFCSGNNTLPQLFLTRDKWTDADALLEATPVKVEHMVAAQARGDLLHPPVSDDAPQFASPYNGLLSCALPVVASSADVEEGGAGEEESSAGGRRGAEDEETVGAGEPERGNEDEETDGRGPGDLAGLDQSLSCLSLDRHQTSGGACTEIRNT